MSHRIFARLKQKDAAERIKATGGKILTRPQQVPGDAWIIKCVGPQGAELAIGGSR